MTEVTEDLRMNELVEIITAADEGMRVIMHAYQTAAKLDKDYMALYERSQQARYWMAAKANR